MPRLVPRSTWEPRFFEGRPPFAPIAEAAQRFASYPEWPTAEEITREVGVSPIRFVTASPPPSRRRRRTSPVDARSLYDGSIVCEGVVPTRPRSWHDFFNVLVWLAFPGAKRALHARQYRAHAARLSAPVLRLPGARTREQDALAMVDEGGLVLLATAASRARADAALATGAHDDMAVLVADGEVAPLIFGHALYEHLVSSDAPVRACGVVVAARALSHLPPTLAARRALADELLAARLDDVTELVAPSTSPAVPLASALFDP